MNWIKNNMEEIIHHSMTWVGGICAVYAIMIRGGNFGAAQTSNLIALVLDFAAKDIPSLFTRIRVYLPDTLLYLILIRKESGSHYFLWQLPFYVQFLLRKQIQIFIIYMTILLKYNNKCFRRENIRKLLS